jgi:hypothetical protein
MSRLKLEMSFNDAVFALSDGNPGAIKVLTDSMRMHKQIDPDSGLGDLGLILNLDNFEIYGPRIWMLYKDLCGEDLPRTTAVVRAVQLGILPRETLDGAIDGNADIDIEDIARKVQEELPRFSLT